MPSDPALIYVYKYVRAKGIVIEKANIIKHVGS